MYRVFAFVLSITLLSGALLTASASPEQHELEMQPGDELALECNGRFVAESFVIDPGMARILCVESENTVDPGPPATATPEPTTPPELTATPIVDDPEPTPTPEPDACTVPDGADVWHAPTDHEHGDKPPAWADDYSCETFGHPVIFGGDEQTPNENLMKHHAFIGFHHVQNGHELYFRVHAQSNPMGRSVPYHSFEAYVLDPSGGVSMIQGWLDYGIFPDSRDYRGQTGDPSERPAIFGASAQVGSEQWYSRPGGNAAGGQYGGVNNEITGAFIGGWYPDTSLTFLDATTTFSFDESAYVHDHEAWPLTGKKGVNRLAGFHWYNTRTAGLRGLTFYATQFGEIAMGGLDDPLCSGTTTVYGKTYDNVCLRQEVSQTLTQSINMSPAHKIGGQGIQIPN